MQWTRKGRRIVRMASALDNARRRASDLDKLYRVLDKHHHFELLQSDELDSGRPN